MTFKIKNITINDKYILAPMLEYTTLPFRLLCKQYGCDLTYTEMVHTNQIVNVDIGEIEPLKSCSDDTKTSVQLVGDFTKKEELFGAIDVIDSHKYLDIIDLNLGCPSLRITKGNSGSALLKDITQITDIIKEAKQICKKPFTVKIRLGFLENNVEFIANELFKTNIDALAIHGRTYSQNYAVPSDIESVLKVARNNPPIPIIYNGDINLDTYESLTKYSEFSGYMVGRSALTNPDIFGIMNGTLSEPIEKKQMILEFRKLAKKYDLSFAKQKVTILQLIHKMPRSRVLRNQLSQIKNEDDLDVFLDSI